LFDPMIDNFPSIFGHVLLASVASSRESLGLTPLAAHASSKRS